MGYSVSDSRLDSKANRILHCNNAQEIVKALADLEEHRAEFAARWLWELIQNARDFPDESRPMTIRISVSPERIAFAHNGRDFTEDEILSLILQVRDRLSLHPSALEAGSSQRNAARRRRRSESV